MLFHGNEPPQLRDDIRAALIHQARQPLFTLQNYLSATIQLASRQPASADVELMQKCLAQMQASIDKISNSLTMVAQGSGTDGQQTEVQLNDFIQQAFQLANFVIRRRNLHVEWKVSPDIIGSQIIDVAEVRLVLIRWVLDFCAAAIVNAEEQQPVISAEPSQNGILIRGQINSFERSIELETFTKTPPDAFL